MCGGIVVRIASVRYPNSDKTLDYLCPDKTIKEGDVVILEGMDKPHYIAEIKNILDTTLPLKKVLSKAVSHTNHLSFHEKGNTIWWHAGTAHAVGQSPLCPRYSERYASTGSTSNCNKA